MKALPSAIFEHAVAETVLEQARAIKLLILDVDGVLTNGEIYITASGEEIKAFNTLDGHGLKITQFGEFADIFSRSGTDAKMPVEAGIANDHAAPLYTAKVVR